MVFVQNQIAITWLFWKYSVFTLTDGLIAKDFLLCHEEGICKSEMIWTFLIDSDSFELDKIVKWAMKMGMIDIESTKEGFDYAYHFMIGEPFFVIFSRIELFP